jgi:hypothetical protein
MYHRTSPANPFQEQAIVPQPPGVPAMLETDFGAGLVVQKFGGSSVATAEAITGVACRIMDTYESGRRVVVVPAMGDTTDGLLDLAAQVAPAPAAHELGPAQAWSFSWKTPRSPTSGRAFQSPVSSRAIRGSRPAVRVAAMLAALARR